MADLRTFADFKNWLLVAAVGVIISLLSLIATDNRRRIEVVETKVEERGPVLESLASRITAVESRQDTTPRARSSAGCSGSKTSSMT